MPKTCCSCRNAGDGYYPQSGDTCMCGYACLNGWLPIVGAQLLAMCGMIFSIATLADCSFMELDTRLFFPEDMDENLPLKVTQTQFVGFLTWKKLDGSCYWYNSGSNWEDQMTAFHEIVGIDWKKSFIAAAISASVSFVFFCYLLSFTCSSQVRGVRYFNAVFLCLVLTALQGITFLAFTSSFCDDYGCNFSRSAGLSAASMICFFLSGLCFCFTTDYAGPDWDKEKPTLVPMKIVQVAPDQPKGMDVPVPDQMQRASREDYNDNERYLPSAGTSDNINNDDPDIEEVMPDYEEEEFIEEEIIDEEEEEEGSMDDIGHETSMEANNEYSLNFGDKVEQISSDGTRNNESAENGNDDVAARPDLEAGDDNDDDDAMTEYTEVSEDESKR